MVHLIIPFQCYKNKLVYYVTVPLKGCNNAGIKKTKLFELFIIDNETTTDVLKEEMKRNIIIFVINFQK